MERRGGIDLKRWDQYQEEGLISRGAKRKDQYQEEELI